MPNLIGTAPDQVPVNGFLGNMAFQNKEGVVTDLLSTTALTVTGNVGIGTSSPNNKLQVNGANVGIRISDTSGTTDFHEIQSGGVNGQNLFIDADRNNLSGNMIFRVAGATERMRIDSSGNFMVGTTSSSGSASNTARVIGGVFSTLRSSASVATNTATTIATLPSGEGNYMVSASLNASATPADYNEVAMVCVSQSNASITVLANAAQLSLSMSGLNLQVTHLQGLTQTIQYSVLRIL